MCLSPGADADRQRCHPRHRAADAPPRGRTGRPVDPHGPAPSRTRAGRDGHSRSIQDHLLRRHYHADYATILAAPADLPAAVRAATRRSAMNPMRRTAASLGRGRPASPARRGPRAGESSSRHFGDRAQEQGWTVVREHEDVCPVITAPSGDWDEYLAGLDKTARHEIRRKLRRAATVGDLSIEIGPPDSEAIDQFIALHGARFGEDGLFPATEGGRRSRNVHSPAWPSSRTHRAGRWPAARCACPMRRRGSSTLPSPSMTAATCYLYNAGMDPRRRPRVSGRDRYRPVPAGPSGRRPAAFRLPARQRALQVRMGCRRRAHRAPARARESDAP